jgi:hypothetical protein
MSPVTVTTCRSSDGAMERELATTANPSFRYAVHQAGADALRRAGDDGYFLRTHVDDLPFQDVLVPHCDPQCQA